MSRKICRCSFLGAGLLLFATASQAQENPPPPPGGDVAFLAQVPAGEPGGPPPFGGPIELLGFEAGGHSGKVVTGAPFTAVAVSETTQTLQDGNTIDRKTQTNLYRDSQGRFRKDGTIQGFGPLAAYGQSRTFVVIHDPVAGKTFFLDPEKKVAHEAPARPSGAPGGKLGSRPPDANVTTQDLGTQTIAGVSAQGKLSTRTIPAGQLGNAKPIVITFESWYSPDLQIVVMSKRSDPRFGTTTYTLTNIQRTEPNPSLFTVPSDYSVQQGRGPLGMHKPRGPAVNPPPGD